MTRTVVELARAKINLALHVLGRRRDGYHELDSVVAFADIGDKLEISEANSLSFEVTGTFAAYMTVGADNLVLRAVSALAEEMRFPAVALKLEKQLPVASGIGGGSADAAAAIRGILRLFDAHLDETKLQRLALSLGADVPVCLGQRASRMQGIGEKVSPLARLPAPAAVLVNPGVPCATAAVFARLGLETGQTHGGSIDLSAPETWQNDLEPAACHLVPSVAEVLTSLRLLNGFTAVRMSGSGATCFGLAPDRHTADSLAAKLSALHPKWWIRSVGLS